jgi:anti-sigma B factor antagonist
MAFGGSPALSSRDEAVAQTAVAHPGHDVPIHLSCQISAGGRAVIALRGDLDLATVDRVVRYVTDMIDRHAGPASVDLHGVTFCDACGLGALIRVAAHAERTGRRLTMTRPSAALTKIMRITGVDHLLLAPAVTGRG